MIVVALSRRGARFSGYAREESGAFCRVQRVCRNRHTQHITVAVARPHEPRGFMASAIQKHVSQLVPEGAAKEPGDQKLSESRRARAGTERVDQHARAIDAEENQLSGAPLNKRYPAE